MINLNLMRKRLEYFGGTAQEDRMINDKFRAFQRALLYSYQGCDVTAVQNLIHATSLQKEPLYRALINPDKVKQDYDDKILSIDYKSSFSPGDIFKWIGTNTYWLIYLQALTEDAYFRSEIRRCKHIIRFKDKNGDIKQTWAAIRGPVETKIDTIQKNQVRIDRPNWSLHILMPLNEDVVFAFDRYSRFLLDGKAWQVEAVDSLSTPNILEVQAEEYYIDRDADDLEEEVANGLIVEKIDPNPQDLGIQGLTFIKPNIAEIYTAPDSEGVWSVKEKEFPICLKTTGNNQVTVIWKKTTSGQFTLQWTKGDTTIERIIVVESLF